MVSKNKKSGLNPDDEKKILDLLDETKRIYTSLVNRYELRADSIELTDGRKGAAKAVKEEIDLLKNYQEEVLELKKDLLYEKEQVLDFKSKINEILELLEIRLTGSNSLLFDEIKELLNEDNYNSLYDKILSIDAIFEKYFTSDKDEETREEILDNFYDRFKKFNAYAFEKSEDFDGDGVLITKAEVFKKVYHETMIYHDKLFIDHQLNDGEITESIVNQIDSKKRDLDNFHNKIFSKKNEDSKTLNEALEERMENLKKVEQEARKIMNLSSTAGLAGGFFDKANAARKNKIWSSIFFASTVLAIVIFNFWHIDFTHLDEMSVKSIVIRAVINIPFLWLATVANINLNKYSRLEQEYGHKEALAKSYESYKDEIAKLPDTIKEVDKQQLHAELIKINLEAFKKNPALDVDNAQSNFFLEKLISSKPELSKLEKKDDKNEKGS